MANYFFIIFLVAILQVIIFVFHKSSRSRRAATKHLLPPSPPKLPIIGNLHQLGSNPHLSLTHLADELGPIIFLQLGDVPTIVVSSAEMAEQVMKTHDRYLCSRPQLFSAKILFYNCTNIVFSPYGSYWRHVRKISILELFSTNRVQSFATVRKEEVFRLVQRIESAIAEKHSSGFSLTRLIGLYANDVLCRAVLGRSFSLSSYEGSSSNEYDRHGFQSMLNEYQELLGGFAVGDFFSGFKGEFLYRISGQKSRVERTFRRFDRFFDEMIEEHQVKRLRKEKDLLDVLLDVHRESVESSTDHRMPLTRDNIKAILLDMFAAGTDTTFITLDWAMTELIMNPDIMKRAQNEIRSIVGEDTKLMISEDDLPKLHYLKAIVKEVFRLHPPVPILVPRESMEQVTIMGYHIAPKTRVIVNVWAIGRDPKVWVEPERFNPDRFVGSSVDFRGQNFELIPFGSGRRICPGIEFGTTIVELGLAQLLCRFDWELPSGVQGKDLDLKESFGISMHKISDLFVVARLRV